MLKRPRNKLCSHFLLSLQTYPTPPSVWSPSCSPATSVSFSSPEPLSLIRGLLYLVLLSWYYFTSPALLSMYLNVKQRTKFFFIVDWIKRSTRDSLWTRVRSKFVYNVGSLSTNILHHIVRLLNIYIDHMVLHETITVVTPPRC